MTLFDLSRANSIETRSGRVIKIPPLPSMKQIRYMNALCEQCDNMIKMTICRETNSQFELRLKLIKKDGAKRMTDMRSQKHSVKYKYHMFPAIIACHDCINILQQI